MKFKISSNSEEFDEFINLNETVRNELTKVINKHSALKLSLDPNEWTFQSRSVLNQDIESLNKTFKAHKMNQNSVIIINDKRGVELALNKNSF